MNNCKPTFAPYCTQGSVLSAIPGRHPLGILEHIPIRWVNSLILNGMDLTHDKMYSVVKNTADHN